jgi:hypothetical protein
VLKAILALPVVGKLYLVFDEAHKLFHHDGLTKLADWSTSRGEKDFDIASTPALGHLSKSLSMLYEASVLRGFRTVPIFLSAVGDFSTSKIKVASKDRSMSTSEVIEVCLAQWMKTPVTKLVNSGNNSERNYNMIYKIHREGAFQIGGADALGRPLVYEAMLNIAFKWLIKGRMLFIVRRQQVDAFSAMLDEKIKESGSFFSYTSDRDYWNAVDETTMQPLYNIVIVREDELDDLEGVNIDGLKAVYLFSLGKTKNLYQKMQGLGRVGRLGQEASYCFVMIDCATKRNGAVEAESSPFLMEAMNSNGTCRPHIVEVRGVKALDIPSDIPVYCPNLYAPTPEKLKDIQKVIKKANRKQVCKFMRYSPKSGSYECPSVEKGFKCAWYHPQPNDFKTKLLLKCCTFNTSYCKKGVFREAACHCIKSLAPIKQVTSDTVAWTKENPLPSSILSTEFPALGCDKPLQQKKQDEKAPETKVDVMVNPRLSRPVCRFAAMDMYKCKTRRMGKLCSFRHPEEVEDKVTDEEYLEALEISIANLNKTKTKYGQKPMKFSKDLYYKYNYPGRHKSNLAKPFVQKGRAVVTEPSAPVMTAKTLNNVLTEESVDGGIGNSIFAVLQSAHSNKRVVDGDVKAGNSSVTAESVASHQMKTAHATSLKGKNPTNYFNLLEEEGDDVVDVVEDEQQDSTVTEEAVVEEGDSKCCPISDMAQEEQQVQQDDEKKALLNDLESGDIMLAGHDSKAQIIVNSGLQGSKIVEDLGGDLSGTTAASLMKFVLLDVEPNSIRSQLFAEDGYGCSMQYLLNSPSTLSGRISAQVDVLNAIVNYCNDHQFPKVDVKSSKKYLIDVLFRVMYAFEHVEEDAFFTWHEEEARDDLKMKAILQTTDFFGWLLQEEDNEEEVELGGGDEYDDDCHFNRTVSSPPPTTLSPVEETRELSKAERKALKQQRRQNKLSDRGDNGSSKLSFLSSSSSSKCYSASQ